MAPRIQDGWPRGGVGHLGILLGIATIAVALKAGPPFSIAMALSSLPLAIWLGLGLRSDGEAGEATDQVTWEGRPRYWYLFEGNWVEEFRLSSGIILASLVGLAIALYRLYRPH